MKRWSAKFDWQERARSLDARDEMVRRVAIDAHLQAQAADRASREAKITERILEIREAACEQSLRMLAWPLAEQRVVRDEDGEDEVEWDFSHLSEEEIEAYLAIDQKIRAMGRKRSG
jgi:hypothetical protein